MSQFKEVYLDALASVEPGNTSKNALTCIGIEESRFNILRDGFEALVKEFAKALEDGETVKRSDLWVRCLYELEPNGLMEVFLIGNMIGTFESTSTNFAPDLGKDDSSLTKMHMIFVAATVMEASIREALSQGDNDFIKKALSDFRELVQEALG